MDGFLDQLLPELEDIYKDLYQHPELSMEKSAKMIGPVTMAVTTTLRLQTIVSREVAPIENAVLTIGSLQAGTEENIILEEATLNLNIRTFKEEVGDQILSAVKRICCAECAASNAPETLSLRNSPVTRPRRMMSTRWPEFHKPFPPSLAKRLMKPNPRLAARISAF
ncbi:hypothetical protein GCM10011405_41280 [Rufibacter glacialis]|nr:hypothetical protein GCM10011405_41280 [Rufibacter glacialis]